VDRGGGGRGVRLWLCRTHGKWTSQVNRCAEWSTLPRRVSPRTPTLHGRSNADTTTPGRSLPRSTDRPGPAGEGDGTAVEQRNMRSRDGLAPGKRSRLGQLVQNAATAPTTRAAPVTHALKVDPRSARARSIMASCTAPGCTWTIRGVPDVEAAQ